MKIKMEILKEKVNEEKQLVFGWASMSVVNGQPVIDSDGDIIPLSELESAAYRFVAERRIAGEMHEQAAAADLVESFVVTPEKCEAFGLLSDKYGWLVGWRINDAELWAKIKRGQYSMLSIGLKAERTDINDRA